LAALTDDLELIARAGSGDEPKLLGARIMAELMQGDFRVEQRSNTDVFLRLFIPRISR
jgi:hypothetical protein